MNNYLIESGGGLNGAYGAGVIKGLIHDCGFRYEGYAGVSVGAINLAFMAQFTDDEVKAGTRALEALWQSIKGQRSIVRERGGFDLLETLAEHFGDFAKPALVLTKHPSVFLTDPLRRLLKRNIDPAKIRASGKKLRIAATDLHSGSIEIWKEDSKDILDGVMASCAFPAAFPPVKTKQGYFLDGGLRDVTPLGLAFDMNASIPEPNFHTIVHDGKGIVSWAKRKPTGIDILGRTLGVMMDEIIENDLQVADLRNRLAAAGNPYKPTDVVAKIGLIRQKHTVSGAPINPSPKAISQQLTFGWADAMKFGDGEGVDLAQTIVGR